MSEQTLSTDRRTDRATADMVARAEADPHRPRYHFVSPAGWLNDPNGVGQVDGIYHLFYQYNPHAPVHERIHWGHAASRDLVHWTDEPVALVPGTDGPDVDGCWSGVLVDDGGVPTIVYSGRHGERELPCVAVGSHDLRTWTPLPQNPVIRETPPGIEVTAYRDHAVWRESDRWRQIVGSGIRGQGGTAFLYESQDLREWRYVGPLLVGDAGPSPSDAPDWSGTMWECVDLFRVGDTDVLVFSAWDDGTTLHPLYWTGTYEGDKFMPSGLHRLDYGGRHFYAPQSFTDATGRRVMFGWMQEARPEQDCVLAGWSGVMSLPRTVTLAQDGTLELAPVAEVDVLRRDGLRADVALLHDGVRHLLPHSGDQLDLELDVRLPAGARLELGVRVAGEPTEDTAERTVVVVERAAEGGATLVLDRSRSSLDPTLDTSPHSGPFQVGPDDAVSLRVLVDHSALEVFANGRALASRVYPTRPDALGLDAAAHGPTVEVVRAETWRMADAFDGPRALWPEP
jgi:beta-fructofuranosidase